MDSQRTTPSPRPLIPPIIRSEKDRSFLQSLNHHISTELSRIDQRNPEQSYIVHKDAFDKIIDYVTAYKPLLTAVKAEYEDCIDTIQRGQREAFYLSGKLKSLATEPSTIHNYRKRADDLEQKLKIITSDNEKLKLQLRSVREARLQRDQKSAQVDASAPEQVKKDNRHIPGLSLQQSTDTKTLTKELEKVEKQLKDLNISYKTRFSPKEIRDALKEQLSGKVLLRDQLQEQTAIQKQKRQKLKVAVEAAEAYTKIQPPHQSIGEAVVSALARSGSQVLDKVPSSALVEEPSLPRTTPSNSFEDIDPSQEKEAELMLEYIEKFNEFLEDNKYEEAAVHAANSPKGILRTPETLHRFKELQQVTSSGRSTLLAFCAALMATVPAYPTKPSDYLSLACVQCALEANRLDLVTHWLSQDRLTLTEGLGDTISGFSKGRHHLTKPCLALSQKVYIDVQAHRQATCCMVKQGRIGQAMEYAQKVALPPGDCAAVLGLSPSMELALGLYETRVANKRLVPMGRVAHTLLTCGADSLSVHFIRHLHQLGEQDAENSPSPLRNAVFEDDQTTEDQWHDIVEACQRSGYHDSSIDILAAVTVIMSVRRASVYVEMMEKQRLEEDRQRQLQAAATAAAAGKKKDKKKKKRRQVQVVEEPEMVAEGSEMAHQAEVVRFGGLPNEEEEEEEE